MRRPRLTLSEVTCVYHCISRIVAGEFLLSEATAKESLLNLLKRQAAFCGVQIITYSLMSNHFHVLTRVPHQTELSDQALLGRVKAFYGKTAGETRRLQESIATIGKILDEDRTRLLKRMNNVSTFMKELKQSFSVWYNKKHNRYGTLWSERFRSILVQDRPDVVRTVAAYIDLNPVRAGMVEDPADYRFCGYAAAAAGNALEINGIASFEGDGEWRWVVGKYRETLFCRTGAGHAGGTDELNLEKVREIWNAHGEMSQSQALRLSIRYLIDGAALGSQAFAEEMFERFRDRFGPKRKTGARRLGRLPFKQLRTLRQLRVSGVQ